MPDTFACALDRRRDPASERDVVVFDEHAVVKSEAMVAPAARKHRVLFQHTQTRRRLARINDLRMSAFDRSDVFTRQRGDTRKTLKQIERDTLASEQDVCEAARACDDLP